jgi:hypothetical protein
MIRDNIFDGVILVDGVGRRELEQIMPEITHLVEGHGLKFDPTEAAVYDMAYCLEPSG